MQVYTILRICMHTHLYVYKCIRDLVVLFYLLKEIVRAHAAVDAQALPEILKSQCPSKCTARSHHRETRENTCQVRTGLGLRA